MTGRSSPPDDGRLSLLSGFRLEVGGNLSRLPMGAQRTIALLALVERPPQRTWLTARLWPDLDTDRAAATLRTVLWQLRRSAPGAIVCDGQYVVLDESVAVDVHLARAYAGRIEQGPPPPGEELFAIGPLLCHDLLPDWHDDWALVERERFRQIRLHALEGMSRLCSAAGRHSAAVEFGLRAVAADPLRESAQRTLIEAHLAEDNRSEAIRQYRHYHDTLLRDLGVHPTPDLTSLIRGRKEHTQ